MKQRRFKGFLPIMLLVSLTIIMVGVVFSWQSFNSQKQAVIESSYENMTFFEQTVSQVINSELDDPTLDKEINNLFNETSLDRVTFYSIDGEPFYSTSSDLSNQSRQMAQEVIDSNRFSASQKETYNGDLTILHYTKAVRDKEGQLLGVLQIADQLLPFSFWDSSKDSFVFTLIASIILGLVSASWVYLYVVQPLEKLNKSVSSIDSKDEDYQRVIRGRNSQINQIGRELNQAVESLGKANQKTGQAKDEYFHLVNHLNVGVMILNDRRQIEVINQPMVDILEYDANNMDLINRNYVEVCRSYELLHFIESVFDSGEAQETEIQTFVPNEHVLLASANPYRREIDGRGRVLIIVQDVTENRHLEQVRTDFVTNASHELRTPVTAIQGFAETLVMVSDDPEATSQFSQIILKESKRLTRLIKDILDLSKFEQPIMASSEEYFDVEEAVRSCFNMVSQTAEDREIKLEAKVPEKILFYGDRGRFEQIIANLVANGVNYSDQGSKVTVSAEKQGQDLVIKVIDNGMGIPENELPRIFERFYRVDKARSRNSGGTGLGLSIVRNLVINFGGNIEVTSKLGLGTQFTVTLPLKKLE